MIVVDAAILIAAAMGRSTGAFAVALTYARLAATDRVLEEVRSRLELGLRRQDLLAVVDALEAQMSVTPVTSLAARLAEAEAALRDAVASRNGSTGDAHVLALAWALDGDIWSTDRDFAGTGVASWSTPNLMVAIGKHAGAQ